MQSDGRPLGWELQCHVNNANILVITTAQPESWYSYYHPTDSRSLDRVGMDTVVYYYYYAPAP